MKYYYSPEVRFLCIQRSEKKVEVLYNENIHPWELPLVGSRPPYYTNPRYEAYYPLI